MQRPIVFFLCFSMPLLVLAQADCPDPTTFCGEGTSWDEPYQTCVVTQPSDSNFDGCVQLNDLLDLLSVYGASCGAESSWNCGDDLTHNEHVYATIELSGQC